MKEKILAVVSWVIVAGIAVGVLGQVHSSGWVSQPAPFNHKKHADYGVACSACHLGAKTQAEAGIPNVRVCALCHIPGQESPATPPKLAEMLRGDQEMAWGRVYELSDDVRFSHALHARSSGIDCVECHGAMAERGRPLSHRLVGLDMNFCMDCHKREGATTDCMACHR